MEQISRRAGESVALLRRNPAGWMPARMERLSAGVGRRHPVKLCGHFTIPNLLGLFSNTPGNRRKTRKFLSWTVARLIFEITFMHFNANCTIMQEKSTGCGTDSGSGKCCYDFFLRGKKLTFMLSVWGLCGRKGTRNIVQPIP